MGLKKDNENYSNKSENNLLIYYIKENNRIRKRSFIIKLLVIIFIIGAFLFNSNKTYKNNNHYHTAVIKINDIILSSKQTNAENIIKALKNAYSNKYVKGIILEIDSPGG